MKHTTVGICLLSLILMMGVTTGCKKSFQKSLNELCNAYQLSGTHQMWKTRPLAAEKRVSNWINANIKNRHVKDIWTQMKTIAVEDRGLLLQRTMRARGQQHCALTNILKNSAIDSNQARLKAQDPAQRRNAIQIIAKQRVTSKWVKTLLNHSLQDQDKKVREEAKVAWRQLFHRNPAGTGKGKPQS